MRRSLPAPHSARPTVPPMDAQSHEMRPIRSELRRNVNANAQSDSVVSPSVDGMVNIEHNGIEKMWSERSTNGSHMLHSECRMSVGRVGCVACADCLVSFRHSSLFFNLFINCLMHNNVISNNYMRAVFMALNEIIYMLLIGRFMHTKWMNRLLLFKFQVRATTGLWNRTILGTIRKAGSAHSRIYSAANNILKWQICDASWHDLQFAPAIFIYIFRGQLNANIYFIYRV